MAHMSVPVPKLFICMCMHVTEVVENVHFFTWWVLCTCVSLCVVCALRYSGGGCVVVDDLYISFSVCVCAYLS